MKPQLIPAPRLTAYRPGGPFTLRAAPSERDWMTASHPIGYARRCLPLPIANAVGWEVLCEHDVEACWLGGPLPGDTLVKAGNVPVPLARSDFGNGIVSFLLGAIFRTNPGWQLLIRGPVNRPKDGASPLEGVVETAEAYQSATANWMLTRKEWWVKWRAGEPICTVVPIRLDLLEGAKVEVRPLADDPALEAEFAAWTHRRDEFNRNRPPGQAQGWTKSYMRGEHLNGAQFREHRTRLRLAAPETKHGAADGTTPSV